MRPNSLCDAVGCGENVDVGDEGAAAKLPVAVEDRRHERKLMKPRLPTVHNLGQHGGVGGGGGRIIPVGQLNNNH